MADVSAMLLAPSASSIQRDVVVVIDGTAAPLVRGERELQASAGNGLPLALPSRKGELALKASSRTPRSAISRPGGRRVIPSP